MIYAFTDASDGYYEVEVPDGQPLPAWTQALIPTEVRPVTPPPLTTAQQIAELDRQSGAPRWMRALALGLMEKEAVTQGATQGLNATQSIALLRAGNPGYRRLKEIEEQIAVLEALL